jgi:hypothetical protein
VIGKAAEIFPDVQVTRQQVESLVGEEIDRSIELCRYRDRCLQVRAFQLSGATMTDLASRFKNSFPIAMGHLKVESVLQSDPALLSPLACRARICSSSTGLAIFVDSVQMRLVPGPDEDRTIAMMFYQEKIAQSRRGALTIARSI